MPQTEPKASRAWIGYVLVTAVALALSGLFTPEPGRAVPYDQAIAMVNEDRIEQATISSDTVGLVVKAQKDGPPEKVRTTRLPGVTDEPLVNALLEHHVRIDAQSSRVPAIVQVLLWAAPLVLVGGLVYLAARRLGSQVGTGPLSALKSRARVYDRTTEVPVRFDDVAGVDEAKGELVEVVDFLKNPGRYRALGGRIPRGLLLVGPPGTGKTLLARAVAGEANVPFVSLNASEFVEMFVGLGAARVRELFEQARKTAPSIVFIDEIDAVGRVRGPGGSLSSHDEREQTLHQLLAELDGFDGGTTLMILAATNRPEVLDPALLRPGRFDRQVIVDRPDVAGRLAILRVHAKRLPLAPDADLPAVARRTPGMSGADLANIVNEAALAGARRGGKFIGQADFAEALDRVQLGLRRRGIILTTAERRRVAYHETGHALVAMALPLADPVERVSIVARTVGALGATIQVARDERHVMTERELESRITVLLGGRAAEEVALDEVSTGAHDDLGKATALLRDMVTRLGMSRRLGLATLTRAVGSPMLGVLQEERLCSEETAHRVDDEVRERVEELYAAAKRLLEERRPALEACAERLLVKETVSGEELAAIASTAGAQGTAA